MKKAQALQVMCALFETEEVGFDGESTIEKSLNRSFLRACSVACPELPAASGFMPWLKTDTGRSPTIEGDRSTWARFFRELADGIEGMEERQI